jgi:phosphoglycerol transferase MdoB-like AlkP superfamily enzyme
MDALKLLLAFSPWIAFWIISGGQSMVRLKIGICVAAILVLVMGITRLHRGLILWAGVVFFAFALVAVVFLQNLWVIKHLGILASGTLFMATMVSIMIGQPFTESYAREQVPREMWQSPGFIRSSYTVTGVWGLVFLANTLVNGAKAHFAELGEWFFRGVELSILVLGVAFTTLYSRLARRKRGLAASKVDSIKRG